MFNNLISLLALGFLATLFFCTPETYWVAPLGATFANFMQFCQANLFFSGIVLLVIAIGAFMTKKSY